MARKKASSRRDNRTGAIFKDGDGYRAQILLHYNPATGKPVYKKVRASTHEQAVEALAKLQHSARLRPTAAPTSMTLGSFIDQWLESRVRPARAPKTYAQYRWVLTTHVVPTLGKKRVDHVTRADVQSLVASLAKQPVLPKSKPKEGEVRAHDKDRPTLSRRTVAAAVTVLHKVYEDAIRDGFASSNPTEYIALPAAKAKPPAFLSADQVNKLNEKLGDSPVRYLVRFMLATGARLGEATGIRWQDVDLSARTVRIAGQLQRLNKKLEYRPTTKTNQDRTLIIPQWMADEFKDMKAKQLIDGYSDADGIAFLNTYGRRFDPKYVYNELAEACKKAEIPRVSPHKLRHTFATVALMETGDMHGVQKMLGHQQIALTANLYAHATAERTRGISEAVGRTLDPKRFSQSGFDE